MKNSSFILFRTLLLSTSAWNVRKYSKDKKDKGKFVGQMIGMFFVYLLIVGFICLMSVGYGMIGLSSIIPGLCILTISGVSFFFTLLKTNGYLFNFREFDMLMSLPFDAKTVAGCKFLYMYVKSMALNICVSIAMLIAYAVFEKPAWWAYVVWMLLTMIVPVISMLIASFFGFLIAKFTSGFKRKNIIQTVLILLGTTSGLFVRFFVQELFEDGRAAETLENMAEPIEKAIRIYFPARWFELAVNGKVIWMLLLIAFSAALFEVVFFIVGRSYREINSKLKTHATGKKFKMTEQKTRSLLNTIAYKEFKRLTGSPTYFTNVCMGELLAMILAVAALFIDPAKMIRLIANDAPITPEGLFPAVPVVIYFLLGMVSTCAISPSLEGKNYWIVGSLPILKKDLYKGKMLFNMYLTVPFMLIATICLGISLHMPVPIVLLSVVTGFTLLCFSSAWGCVCGLKHLKLDWENEIEVVKQGTAVSVYLLPNMIVSIILLVLTIVLGSFINSYLLMGLLIFVSSLLGLLSYRRVMSLARE